MFDNDCQKNEGVRKKLHRDRRQYINRFLDKDYIRMPRPGEQTKLIVYGDNLLSAETSCYFQAVVSNISNGGSIIVGIFPAEMQQSLRIPDLGSIDNSVALELNTGTLRISNRKEIFGPRCRNNDVIGVHIDFSGSDKRLSFTRNGVKFGSRTITLGGESFYTAVVLKFDDEMALLRFDVPEPCVAQSDDLEEMQCDHCEEDWARLDGVFLNGDVLTYDPRTNEEDYGFAQAAKPLSPSNHYFEMEILKDDERCCMAIGLTHRQYPSKKPPGWVKGSIAYHADDGGIFVENGRNEDKVDLCGKGDRMGCGILFPANFEEAKRKAVEALDFGAAEEDLNAAFRNLLPLRRQMAIRRPVKTITPRDRFVLPREVWAMARVEEDDYFPAEQLDCGLTVTVFFTRNGHVVSKKQLPLPPDGLYPTISISNTGGSISVDLVPFSG